MRKIKGKRNRDIRGGQIREEKQEGKGRSPPELLLTSWQLLSNFQPPLASVLPGHPAQQLPPVFRDWMSLHTTCPTDARQEEQAQRVPSDGWRSVPDPLGRNI